MAKTQEQQQVSLFMDRDLHRSLTERAELEDLSVAQLIRHVLRAYVKKAK